MQKTLVLLETSVLINNYEITDFKQGPDFYYIKAKVILTDGSELFIREFISSTRHIYSFHWQDSQGKLIIRWDNAPHHKHIKTFPHHKHIQEVEESIQVNFEDILKEIGERMKS